MADRYQESADARSGYDAWARNYDSVENATRDLDATVIRKMVEGVSGDTALEIGCGTGKNTGWLAERFGNVTAVDLSQGMLDVASGKLQAANIRFLQHDICEPWPFGDARFDLVTCNLILEHIADLRPIYREAARVLRPQGHLFICEFHPYRQLRGGQAQYPSNDGGCTRIRAYLHAVADYINEGLAAGLTLKHTGEWHADHDELPRLMSVLFRR